ncbi:hypothetical protein N9758_00410 [Flavobacteriaceae bacterium]|nr:hypothetical protein [Flavobacteriaceae bacterium]MDB4203412.1 hypothetical protein [Flavobacteriaceae bacterium]MDC1199106.1 hypothetical protein [Flavobacteriaceae bacterium]
MKKLIYLFLTVLIVGCSSSDDDNNNDGDNDINQNLVGTWVADFVDPENNEVYGNTTLTLNVDNTGSVLSVFTYDGENEVYSATITWSSTTTTITFVYDDGQEDDVLTYYFITDDQLSLTDTEDGFEVILDRVD